MRPKVILVTQLRSAKHRASWAEKIVAPDRHIMSQDGGAVEIVGVACRDVAGKGTTMADDVGVPQADVSGHLGKGADQGKKSHPFGLQV